MQLRDCPTYETEFYSGATYSPAMYNGMAGDDTSYVPIRGHG